MSLIARTPVMTNQHISEQLSIHYALRLSLLPQPLSECSDCAPVFLPPSIQEFLSEVLAGNTHQSAPLTDFNQQTLNETPVRILLSEIFGVQIPALSETKDH